MNSRQKNKWARNSAVGSLLRNAPETAALPGFPRAMALWETANENLRGIAAQQAIPLSTSRIVRDEAFHALEQQTLKVAGQALHYASEKKLFTLANRVRVRPSAFRVLRVEQQVQLARMVCAVVEPLVPQLADYGVTAETLTALEATIEAAERVASAPRDATVNRRGATAELRGAFRAVDEVIDNHLTPLLLPLKQTHPGFYERYRAALEIVQRPGRAPSEDDPVPMAAPAATATPATAPVTVAHAA